MISRISHRVRPYVHNDTDEEFQNSWKHELVKNGTLRLKFSKARNNAKLRKLGYKHMYTFSLPSGYSCPQADICRSLANRKTGKIYDNKWSSITHNYKTRIRCFSASDESRSKQAREQRWYNFDLLRRFDGDGYYNVFDAKDIKLSSVIKASIPSNAEVIRIHVAGDFYNQRYFDAWVEVARMMPHIRFYAYTKSLEYWVNRLDLIPSNLALTASLGGKQDYLADVYNLKTAKIVWSPEQAEKNNLEIDHDDSHALFGDKSFALLLHGNQPKGTEANKALAKLRKQNIEYSYKR